MTHSLLSALHQASLISQSEIDRVQYEVRQHRTGIPEALIRTGVFSDRDLARHLANLFSLPVADVHQFDYQALCQQLAIRPLIERHRILPLAIDNDVLTLGIADPTETSSLDECRFATGLTVQPLLLPLQQLENAIRRVYGQPLTSTLNMAPVSEQELAQLAEPSARTDTSPDDDDAPVSRYLNQLLLDAIRRQASDIHLEPFEQSCRIRFRCDGLLLIYASPPADLAVRLAARLKILARLNIAERRLPQDGRFRLTLNQSLTVDMRVSTLPAQWGEKIVLRLLDNNHIPLSLAHLGYTDAQRHAFEQALERPQGLILVTGPTGSGKTLSLYAGLSWLNQEHRNICTAEDPVEIQLPGINQLQINPAIGLNFSTALRTFLRQDPDVLMIGEIRDQETASMAVRAAQTGHLVLSTLHTNSAADTLTRLGHLGIAPYELGASVSLIIAQRLVRCLCQHCRQPAPIPPQMQNFPDIPPDIPATFYEAHPNGCEHCNQGYLGRTGLFELCTTDPLAATAENTFTITQTRVDGLSLEAAGIRLLCQGLTSLNELRRVLPTDPLTQFTGTAP
ncbi:GspE/PulE family protein [Photobacterium galatheae]|uniref:General secretion pathway protein GspE n=1 Tax=Photobacterium galatheae TaxID=1654360 RepID=A0A066RQM0_9GAMM|nr:ATPase, T2SS/T4P/T4SS family [Photobacterium galatheae]KDM92725.1 general secretion pathway protein GspE [Photobacterium galatheae]MCM0149358.1 Flp pilus assembly complex ATPase component TadA [Photobacterium galatheae]